MSIEGLTLFWFFFFLSAKVKANRFDFIRNISLSFVKELLLRISIHSKTILDGHLSGRRFLLAVRMVRDDFFIPNSVKNGEKSLWPKKNSVLSRFSSLDPNSKDSSSVAFNRFVANDEKSPQSHSKRSRNDRRVCFQFFSVFREAKFRFPFQVASF